jgi:hypothetical protein
MLSLTQYPADVYSFNKTAEESEATILAHAGCSFHRDVADTRSISQATTRTYTFEGSNGSTGGVIDSQNDVGGWEDLSVGSGTPQDEFDHLDAWLSSNGYADRPTVTDYTNASQISALEVYVAQIDPVTGYAIIELYKNSIVHDLIGQTSPDPEIDPQIVTLNARLENGNSGGGIVDFVDPELQSPEPIQSGTIVDIVATPFSGYSFLYWSRNGLVVSLSSIYSYTVPDFDSTLVAVFRLIPVVSTGKRFRGKRIIS